MNEEINDPIVIFYDNTSFINISKNLVMHTNTRHISIKCHNLRELVQDKDVRFEYVNTKEYIIDIFTNDLPNNAHEYIRGKLGLVPLNEGT